MATASDQGVSNQLHRPGSWSRDAVVLLVDGAESFLVRFGLSSWELLIGEIFWASGNKQTELHPKSSPM